MKEALKLFLADRMLNYIDPKLWHCKRTHLRRVFSGSFELILALLVVENFERGVNIVFLVLAHLVVPYELDPGQRVGVLVGVAIGVRVLAG